MWHLHPGAVYLPARYSGRKPDADFHKRLRERYLCKFGIIAECSGTDCPQGFGKLYCSHAAAIESVLATELRAALSYSEVAA